MTLTETLLTAPLPVQLHVTGVVIAILLVPIVLWRGRRDRWHKRLGYVWVLAMLLTALSSFFISGLAVIGPFGPIHLISVYVLWGLLRAIQAVRRRDIATHRAWMQGIAGGGLGVAGLFAFLPGRMMNSSLFGDAGDIGFAVMVAVALIVVAIGRGWVRPRWMAANQ